ncbi:guanine exchange factor for Rac 30-like [Zophobas morio]|uniref:guanine exchange factor for Rac 30-like n=1 Tax=Zophobas morio TaxID=2755281 RepID=UPI0030834950
MEEGLLASKEMLNQVIILQDFFRLHVQSRREGKNVSLKRLSIVQEILKTERSYLLGLKIAVKPYGNALYEYIIEKSAGGLQAKQGDSLSTLISELAHLERKHTISLEKLSTLVECWSESTCIGQLFCEMEPWLNLYVRYCAFFLKGSEQLDVLLLEESFFLKHEEVRHLPLCKKKPLKSFLLMPIQRIPHYVLLFKELLLKTDHSNPDFGPLERVLTLFKDLAASMNRQLILYENTQNLIALRARFTETKLAAPCKRLLTTGLFIKDGVLHCRGRPHKEIKLAYLVLFSGALLHGPAKSKFSFSTLRLGMHKVRNTASGFSCIRLGGAVVERKGNTLAITASTTSLTLVFSCREQKLLDEWSAAFKLSLERVDPQLEQELLSPCLENLLTTCSSVDFYGEPKQPLSDSSGVRRSQSVLSFLRMQLNRAHFLGKEKKVRCYTPD